MINTHMQRDRERGTQMCTDRWEHVSYLPTDVSNKMENPKPAAFKCVLQERPSLWASGGSSVWNWVPVSLPLSYALSLSLSLSLSLPSALSLSLFFPIPLAHCIGSPLCGSHHNACGHTSLSKLFISRDHPVSQTLGSRVRQTMQTHMLNITCTALIHLYVQTYTMLGRFESSCFQALYLDIE